MEGQTDSVPGGGGHGGADRQTDTGLGTVLKGGECMEGQTDTMRGTGMEPWEGQTDTGMGTVP